MNVADVFNLLISNNINYFCGVPDSLLKSFCAYITDNTSSLNHTITANEGNAIGLASGHYLATGKPALVYMQNSGLGNCVNPLLSLTDEDVYNIPLLMFIGWRGEPDQNDEPQHIKQGKVTDKLLEVMGIEYEILPNDFEKAKSKLEYAFEYMNNTKKPYAFIIKKGIFDDYELKNKKTNKYSLTRFMAIEKVVKQLTDDDIVVSTTGHISRELYEIREKYSMGHQSDFLTVGSMGHASSIALGIALNKKKQNVYCFDGDGSFLMHMGSCVVNASKDLDNFKHIIFNNEAHVSVGAQPTALNNANLSQVALNCGYKKVFTCQNEKELNKFLPEFIGFRGCSLLEIKVNTSFSQNLSRPKEKPVFNKMIFMENLKQTDYVYNGAIEKLSHILLMNNFKNILIFTGKKSFKLIEPKITKELLNLNCTYYNDFSSNPKEEEIKLSVDLLNKKYDVIIGIGGGSVIDFAKSYKYYTNSPAPIIAIPTTAGTGAEATQFAVIYINGIKHSINDENILPDYAIVDSNFLINDCKYLKACTALDAYCQAIESYWAKSANTVSKNFAIKAIKIIKDNIVKFVNTQDIVAADNMAKAAHFAGKAINISRTTASHALSYTITSKYNIPHGHAVALTIAQLFNINKNTDDKNLKQLIFDLENIISKEPNKYFRKLFEDIQIEYNFNKLGIYNINEIIENVNLERLNNNPKKLNSEDLKDLFKIE